MDSYVRIGKLHDDVWFCSIFKHVNLMNFIPSMVGLAWHKPKGSKKERKKERKKKNKLKEGKEKIDKKKDRKSFEFF